jgi:2-hydroxychromene-2-carboxylate isomerase
VGPHGRSRNRDGRDRGARPDTRAALAATEDPEIKVALRAATDRALAAGVFGVPTVVTRGAVFWGDDQLEAAARLQSNLAPGAW